MMVSLAICRMNESTTAYSRPGLCFKHGGGLGEGRG
ncbi:hypothetical protein CUJ84_Chr005015 [Rhizobium leguminosarum]|uniref:Uncharacterized protein n=1 Tax=Rhizobium leguminosarum TaxID=384 RepID=A0A2K9ZAL9_RHILE|nr:hypothetical protein CUJ84_Chr005015 [Rhizobium leguminosarum]